jgi:hypothetical protein
MELQVSVEVDPGVFDEGRLREVPARVLQYHHKGWFSALADPARLHALRALPGVLSAEPVLACEDRLASVEPPPEWETIAADTCDAVLRGTLEAGRSAGRVVLLRQTLEATDKCFLRSHRTHAQDVAVYAAGAPRPVCRYSDGLRDRSQAGMHDWKAGEVHSVAMWVGHLPPGTYRVRGGVDGWVRVRGRPTPFVLEGEVRLGA